MNVVSNIKPDLCVGCSACTVVCPSHHLSMTSEGIGRWGVIENNGTKCPESCNLCLRVCPFSDLSDNEDTWGRKLFATGCENRSRPECGFWLETLCGHIPDEEARMGSASGGLATWLLARLVADRTVDAVVTVSPRQGNAPYFVYQVCSTPDEIRRCAGSAYYATHMADALRQVADDKALRSVAIVGLPCFCKAIRNACVVHARLRQKVKYVIGLTCGQQKTHTFTEYIAAKNNFQSLRAIRFRTKKRGRPNANYVIKLWQEENAAHEITFNSYAKEWSFRLFTVPACNFCDDIFAETADAVFMDAWLPEFGQSDKGESLVIVRTQTLANLLSELPTVQPIKVDRVIESQLSVISNKRRSIVEHLKLGRRRGLTPPPKRTHLFQAPDLLERPLIRTKFAISCVSEQLWADSGRSYPAFCHRISAWRWRLFIGLGLNKINSILEKTF